ncbi:MAG: FAD-binding oxidoreductase [Gammaproteobacteria bacterium]
MNKSFLSKLTEIFDNDTCFTTPEACYAYGFDNSQIHGQPDAVILPKNTKQIQKTLELCYEYEIPFTARGRASGTTGAAVPVKGGVVCTFEHMNRIKKIDLENRIAIVEPGVSNAQLQQAINPKGFFWAPDPSSGAYSTIGGNLACNAAGPHAVKYGTCRENTLGLSVVTASGESMRTGVYTTKGVVGYDFTRLLIGSEGTLGVITEATLKLLPLPEARAAIRVTYDSVKSASEAVLNIMKSPTQPCVLEFIDHNCVNIIRRFNSGMLSDEAGAMLIIEVDGPKVSIESLAENIKEAAKHPGLIDLAVAHTDEEAKQLWHVRKTLSPALRTIAPKKINEDVVVPINTIPDFIMELDELSQEYGISITTFGHAGNGNLHVNLLYDAKDAKQNKNAEPCLEAMFDLVIKHNGTLSGEHGVGLMKKPYVTKEIDPVRLALMKEVKNAFDPKGILNPGKVF